MTKTYLNVADDFAGGLLNLAGHPVAYGPGDVIEVDMDSPEQRAIRDLGLGDLSNYQAQVDATTSLIMAGDMVYAGGLSDAAPQGVRVWSFPLYLSSTPTGAKFRIRPGFAGRVIGISAISTGDATTSGKSGSIALGILGDDLSDEIDTITVASGTTPFVLVITDEDTDETFTTAEIAYNADASAVKSAAVTAGIATGDLTVTGTGPWTLTWTGDRADHNITVQILRNEIVTVVVDATGGDFDLAYVGATDPETIAANATQAAFQSAVDALLDAAGDGEAATVVRSGSANSYTYTITGHDGANLAAFSTVATNLTGGAGTATCTVVQQGGATNVSTSTTVAGGSARIVGSSGNPATLDLTSSNVSDGGVIAGETIATGSNAKHGNFGADDVIEATYTVGTAFVEGAVLVQVILLAT